MSEEARGSAPETKSDISVLDDVRGRAENVAGSLQRLSIRLERTVNSIVGNEPSTECKEADQPEPSNHKDCMHSILTRMENLIDSMTHDLDRL